MPLLMLLVVRIPALRGRNGLQFLLTSSLVFASWAVFTACSSSEISYVDVPVALAILTGSSIAFLEIWALLSRGYTIGLLLTLLHAGKPIGESELAALYRGGEGLNWIMEHRLSGLKAARLVKISDGLITLTPLFGVPIARLYRLTTRMLGLQRTG